MLPVFGLAPGSNNMEQVFPVILGIRGREGIDVDIWVRGGLVVFKSNRSQEGRVVM